MKGRLPLFVNYRACSVPNFGHLRSGDDTTSSNAKLTYEDRTVVGISGPAGLHVDRRQA
jgi:hypothetical protein